MQEAMVDVWSRRREVNDLSGWVMTAALNRARSRWRTAAAEQRAFERAARRAERTAATSLGTSSFDARIAQALAGLSRKQREVVALHYLLDMSVADTASRLGIAEGTVKVHLHRARTALQAALSDTRDNEEVDGVRP